jgi:hypothetical protein
MVNPLYHDILTALATGYLCERSLVDYSANTLLLYYGVYEE